MWYRCYSPFVGSLLQRHTVVLEDLHVDEGLGVVESQESALRPSCLRCCSLPSSLDAPYRRRKEEEGCTSSRTPATRLHSHRKPVADEPFHNFYVCAHALEDLDQTLPVATRAISRHALASCVLFPPHSPSLPHHFDALGGFDYDSHAERLHPSTD